MRRNSIEITQDTKNVWGILALLGVAGAVAALGSYAGSEILNSNDHQVRELIHVI